jgi:hypothetical protein
MTRICYLDDCSFDHRQIEAGRHAVIEQAEIAQVALAVVDVLLVERPSKPLCGSTLHLTFDVACMNRPAGVLGDRAAENLSLAGSGSTSRSTNVTAKAGPTPRALTVARPTTGPPVRANLGASCLTVIGEIPSPFALKTRPSKVTSSGFFSQSRAARCLSWSKASCAASYTAWPVARVVLLPPLTSVWPIESVSATTGLTSSMSSPSTSAVIIAIEARDPPISTEPVTTLAVPSL